MNSYIKKLVNALDLRTMPLSLSGVLLGSLLAVADFHVSWMVVLAVCLAAASLHVYKSGANKLALIPSVLFAVAAVYNSFGKIFILESLLMLLFAYFIMRLASGTIVRGRGRLADGLILCFLTGPVAVYGTYFLCSHTFGSWVLLFPALSIGTLCVAASGLKDGYSKSAVTFITLAGLALMSVFPFLRIHDPAHFRFVIMIPIYIMYLVMMHKDKNRTMDTFMPLFAFCLLALAAITGLGFVSYLF